MAEERRLRIYEGLFLLPQAALSELGAAVAHVEQLLDRAEAEVISLAKWDERRLAYDIAGNKRGLYLLAYFRAPADRLADLERDCNLSEKLLRAMIIRADHLTEDQIRSADARQALEDEIKLRRESPQTPAGAEAEETKTADARA